MAKKVNNFEVNNYVLDLITPTGIQFGTNDFWFGSNIAKVLLVMNYPNRVKIGWLSRIANMEGIICSIHANPTNSGNLIEDISKSMGELQSKISNGGSALMIKRAEQAYQDAEKLIEKIDLEQENIFYITIAIMVIATSKDELERKSKRIQSMIAGSKMKARPVNFIQEEALETASPYGKCPDLIKDMASRNMPVSTLAGAFPFNTSGLNDGKGMLFGKDNAGGIILMDIWKRGEDRTNSNWVIMGQPGTGKSTAVKHIFTNEYSQGTKIIIIDPEREYKDLCENLNGQWINCGGGLGGRINPLQVKKAPKDDEENEEMLYKDDGNGMGDLALHFQTLMTFFNLYLKNLSIQHEALLKLTLEELYVSKGITWETDISKIPNDQFPIMEDLYNLLVEKTNNNNEKQKRTDIYDDLAVLIRDSAIGADKALWNGHTTIEANSDFIVLDTFNLQEASDKVKRTQYFNVLTWVWDEVSKNREEKILFGADEGYLMIDPEVPQALQFLRNTSKRIRKYNGGLAIISHSVIDFIDPAVKRFGQALLDNPCYKFFMGTNGKDLKELTELMNLTEAEQEMLQKAKRGQGLLIVGTKRINAIAELADFELELFGKGGGN